MNLEKRGSLGFWVWPACAAMTQATMLPVSGYVRGVLKGKVFLSGVAVRASVDPQAEAQSALNARNHLSQVKQIGKQTCRFKRAAD